MSRKAAGDCFVAALLAMTGKGALMSPVMNAAIASHEAIAMCETTRHCEEDASPTWQSFALERLTRKQIACDSTEALRRQWRL